MISTRIETKEAYRIIGYKTAISEGANQWQSYGCRSRSMGAGEEAEGGLRTPLRGNKVTL
ncbi:hypothetical protein MHH28_09480 [Paenibacillus sp. FSL K6-1217]|uniref:hypothetical protein n=1 Tax=Paenibacillus sp. FSL K6-1217 TaxID=2921466 RepID=UPI00324A6FC5